MNTGRFLHIPLRRLTRVKDAYVRQLTELFIQAVASNDGRDPKVAYQQTYQTARGLGLPADYARVAGNTAASRAGAPFVPALGLGVQAYRVEHSPRSWYLVISGMQPRQMLYLPLLVSTKTAKRLEQAGGDAWLYNQGQRWMLALPLRNQPQQHPSVPISFMGLDLGIARHAVLAGPESILFISARADRARCAQYVQKSNNATYKGRQGLFEHQKAWMYSRNGQISAQIVQAVQVYANPVVIMENLGQNILQRMDRDWEMTHLSRLIESRLRQAGVPVLRVNPRRTSRTCPRCWHIHQSHQLGAIFYCEHCGYHANIDYVAARNLAAAGPMAWQTRRPGTAYATPSST